MRLNRYLLALLLLLFAGIATAQTQFPLNGNGVMGLGNRNGDFFIEQDDLRVKVPGGYARINRDHDGRKWVFNRQWSGLGDPNFYKADYPTIGAFFTCTIIDGINSCDTTASSGTVMTMPADPPDISLQAARIPNDPLFGRLEGGGTPQFVARKGVGFTRSSDGTSYVSSKHPRYVIRPQQVPTLPPSAGPDAHPVAGKPGAGGLAITMVPGYRWIDRSGEWIEYDQYGRIASYGDRNDVRVWFQYGAHGQVERVLDDNGRTVFTLLYAGNEGDFITEVRDHTPLDGSLRRVQYQYDDKGRLRHVIDARGNTTSYEYGSIDSVSYEYGTATGTSTAELTVDTRFRIIKVIDAEGRATQLGYGVTNRLSRIVAPDQGVTELDYGYDKLKKEFSVTIRYPEAVSGRKTETRRYDQEGRVVFREVNGKVLVTGQGSRQSMTYVDERGNAIRIDRDNFDQVTRRTNADGSSISVAYNSASTDPREIVDEAGIATRLVYDDNGNLVSLVEAAGKPEEQVTEYEPNDQGLPELVRRKGGLNPNGTTDVDVEVGLQYDSNGNIRQMVDGEGKIWTYKYDAMGNMLEAISPLNHRWTYTYDNHGNRLTATDPNQLTTHFSYDRTDRLLTLTDARGQVSHLRYDAAGRPWQVEDPTGATISLEYDKAGRLTASSDSMNQRLSLAYDNQDRLVAVTDGESNVTRFEYNDLDGVDRGSDLVAKVNYPTLESLLRYNSRQQLTQLSEVVDGTARSTEATYDLRGLQKTVTNTYSDTSSTEYDALGRPRIGTNELGHTVTLAYDHRNNLIGVTDELGHTTRLEYDRRDKLVREINAENQTTSYVYDDAGRLDEIRRPNGFRLEFDFDAGGRLQERRSYRPDGSLELTDTFDWDNGNRLTGWATRDASSTSTYDDANRLLSETVTVEGVSMTRQYTYYANGQVKTYKGPDGATVTYAYDGNGTLSRVDIPGEGSMSVAERQWTEARKVLLPGGTVQEIERNGLLRPTRLRVRSPSQAILFEQSSVYGKLDEVTSRITQARQVDYTYDDAMRLLAANPSGWSGGTETFQLDAASNRLSDNREQSTWLYDDANRLLQRGEVAYEYDAAGNLIVKVDASLAEPLRTTRYAYDGYNRLVEVRNGADEVVSRYAYDPFGYRISKEVTAAGAANSSAIEGKRLFLQAEEGLLAELAADGTVLQSYGWQVDRPYATAPLFLRKAGSYYYFHNDPLGMPRLLTSKDGATVWSATQISAFGEVVVPSEFSSFEQPWRFPGQYLDAETGLHYNVHRYYDAEIGRYVTSDPAGLAGGINRYAYGNAAPTRFVDPYGLWIDYPDTGDGFTDNVADATFGALYWLTDGWSPSDETVDRVAGYGDTLSFGLTRLFRDWADIGNVDYCSDEYAQGEMAGLLHSLAFGGLHLGRHAAANGAKSLLAETRTFKTVSRRWHKKWGSAEDLDHFFHPNVSGVKGWWNNGVNLLPLSPWVNRQLLNPNSFMWNNFTRWIPHMLRMGAQGAVIGTYGAIPTVAGTKMHDERADQCGCD